MPLPNGSIPVEAKDIEVEAGGGHRVVARRSVERGEQKIEIAMPDSCQTVHF